MEYRQNFRALEAFEAVSRHLSVSAAAVELGVTQSAISHQLRLLSDLVGERLLQKQGRGIALTEAGDRLARKLQPAFAEIVRSVGDAIGGTRHVVRLAICSSFGPAWLVPRLAGFYATKPAFDLQVCMYARDPELTDAVADAFVTTLPTEKGFEAVLLWAEKLVPVVAQTADGATEPALITTDLQPGRHGADWKAYAALSGRDMARDGRWLFASHYLIALEMVKAGLGAALVPDFLAARELEAGTIRQLHDAALPTHEDYHLCVKESRRGEPAIDALIRWFKSQLPRQARSHGNGGPPAK
ncbi:LysR family transcriptional regulator [Aminobacter carboxidus]|uniref:LysR family transcriptional regulator n=2 Tax=Aminobacter carboxidus TaxID=376165 RepID=A0ABR9GXD4_9HYPH|nr:LysR family transcriptional regulator [Aminobacter carboxidus]